MTCNVERVIEALVGAALMAERNKSNELSRARQKPLVVTISRNCGSQGEEVGRLLADRLGVRCCDREILQEVAKRAHVDVELVKTLDEHVKRIEGNWWHALVKGGGFSREQYFDHLVKVILSISNDGGVIIGRGAYLILGQARAFRVRVVGSLPRCAKRIAARERLGIEASRAHVLAVDKERSKYIQELYRVDIQDASCFDLVINSDRFGVEAIVDNILFAMRQVGYTLPEATQSVSRH